MDVKKCDRCGYIYKKNNTHNLETNNLGQVHDTACTAFGYSSEPFITGLTINSTHGQGKKLDLCDKCNGLLIDFLNNKTVKSTEYNPHGDYIPPASRPSKKKWGGFVIVN